MNWLRAMERLINADDSYVENYELISDQWTPGLATFGNEFLLFGGIYETNNPLKGHRLQLKLKYATGLPDEIEAGTDGINLHPSVEIVSLISLHLHKRLFLQHTSNNGLTDHGIPTRHHSTTIYSPFNLPEGFFTPELFQKKGNLTSINIFLENIKLLPGELHRDFIYSAFNYADGIRWIGIDDKIAYLKLVIAVEILAKDNEEIADTLNEKLADLKKDLEPPLKSEIMGFQMQRRIRKSFVKFIIDYKTNFLTSREKAGLQITEDTLEDYLNAIYSSRSDYIHEGRPMAISSYYHDGSDVEMWVQNSIQGTLVTNERQKIPNTTFFESLVRHCLLEYLKTKSRKNITKTSPDQ